MAEGHGNMAERQNGECFRVIMGQTVNGEEIVGQ